MMPLQIGIAAPAASMVAPAAAGVPVDLRSHIPQQQQRVSYSETALEWIQRTKRKRSLAGIPRDPASAAWAFFRPGTKSNNGTAAGTGISFMDAALRRSTTLSTNHSNNYSNNNTMTGLPTTETDRLPVIEIRGTSAKTWTLLSLAARFVVATRPSQFDNDAADNNNSNILSNLPQVILIDSTYDHSIPQLTHVVRSTLLRRMGHDNNNNESCSMETLNNELAHCLARIHIVSVTESFEAVALLEAFRASLSPSQSERPTLLLWDGYLDTFVTESSWMEVIRQVARLLQDCSVVFVSASSSGRNKHDWDKHVTHRIRLDRNLPSNQGHSHLATVHGSRIPFSTSLAGILS